MEDALIFYIQGSAKSPYRIIAEGEGSSFKIFCSCPSCKRRGGKPCKHIFALLQGDITNLVSDNADEVYELRARSEGSTTLEVSALPAQTPAYSSS
ncbi:SWIM zinc finger family protein [Zymomonas mobilis]|uniref:Zinc finger SWIM domain protein n=1 Tax=Zymomonas mobilis subsp. pomaceae (strain ATCC 29192 / DSM 22645 / JCM 10191 / CCUG 17912 / NBRC 13757 / NCIMB 11200 / NRRL B-4491 / Barker I) TaxID=579138 RepID=F8EWH5_ZYMMT|nr:zinc finger SWIM domain protein [Zymomonas mobilis subsp. pomaceae ATCC 29192]